MTITNDNVSVYLASAKIYAYLSGTWTDISADYMQETGMSWSNGIRGNKATDLVASSTTLTFVLDNSTGKYYPGGPSALAGWDDGTLIRLVLNYDTMPYMQFYGRAKLDFNVGLHVNQSRVTVTVLDWLDLASTQPITGPSIQRNKTADQAAQTIVALSPIQPLSTNYATGVTTFPTVFDAVSGSTTAYSELAKIALSECAPLYIKRDRYYGETLVLENSNTRGASVAVKTVPTRASTWGKWKRIDGGDWLRIDGGDWLRVPVNDTLGKISSAYRAIDIRRGTQITNYAKVIAYPRRVDTDPVVLASTGVALPIGAGETKTIKLRYIDPNGGGTRVNALTDYMETPIAASTQDTTLKSLLHFTADVTDSTGYRTWTQNDVTISTDVYADGYGVQRVGENVLGPWAIFGGYANYYITAPASTDFDFGSGAFTIGWYESRINVSAAAATLARDATSSYPPFLLGYLNAATKNMEIYMSSNGSSWNIANGVSMGQVKASRWTHYEISRDANGWFYAFVDGKLVSTWHSALAFPANANPLSVGRTQNVNYAYMGIDELYIYKGKCLHTKDFTPPQIEKTIYLTEDYWANTAQNRTGTNLTSNIAVTPSYGTEAVTLTVVNSGAAGYVYCQVRGLGVYRYDTDEKIAQDAISIAARGYRNPLTLNQPYQQSADAGLTKMQTVITNEAPVQTELISVSFSANRSHAYMVAALVCDVGDLVQISHADSGLDYYYYIQYVEKRVSAANMLDVTWYVRRDYTH